MGAEAAAGEMLARCWRDAGERLAASPFSVGYFVTVDYSKHTPSILHLVSGHAQAAACLLSAGSSLSAVCRQQLVCCLLSANLGDGVAPLPFPVLCGIVALKP